MAASAAGFAPISYGLSESELKTIKIQQYTPPTSEGNNDQQVCTICISDFQVGDSCRVLVCGHLFHKHCVDIWLGGEGEEARGGHRECPVCRREAVEVDEV